MEEKIIIETNFVWLLESPMWSFLKGGAELQPAQAHAMPTVKYAN